MAGWKLGFCVNVVFSDETRVRLNSDGVVRVFRKTGRRVCPKNTQGLSTDKRSMIFWGTIRSDGRKMLIECLATLNKLRIFGDFKAIRLTFENTGFGVPARQRPSTQK